MFSINTYQWLTEWIPLVDWFMFVINFGVKRAGYEKSYVTLDKLLNSYLPNYLTSSYIPSESPSPNILLFFINIYIVLWLLDFISHLLWLVLLPLYLFSSASTLHMAGCQSDLIAYLPPFQIFQWLPERQIWFCWYIHMQKDCLWQNVSSKRPGWARATPPDQLILLTITGKGATPTPHTLPFIHHCVRYGHSSLSI